MVTVTQSTQTFSSGNDVSDICQTPTCHNVASRLLHDMDPSVNPCDDFYKFTCGGYLNSTSSIDNLFYTSKFTELGTSVLENIKMTLEKNSSINDFKYLKLARTLYNTCKNKKDTIWKFMKAIEHWPVLKGSKWNESTFDFRESMFKVGNTTQWKNYLFRFYYTYDGSIAVEPYSTELSPEDLVQGLNNTKVNEYYNSMFNFAELINASVHNTNYTDDLKKILDFEIELARARLLPVQNLNLTFDEVQMTLGELMNNYSFFNWQEYISYLGGSPVDLSTNIIIKNVNYMKKINESFNSTETKRTLANYIIWKHADDNVKTALDLENQNCLDIVLSKLPIAMTAIYFENYNNSKIIIVENEIKIMFLNIKLQILKMITDATWIDNSTKTNIFEELMSFQHKIGDINIFTDNLGTNKFYENLELLDDENFNDAIQWIKLFEEKIRFTSGFGFFMNSIALYLYQSEAFFLQNFNLMIISYIVLQSDFFDIEQPNYMNYGALGTSIGHEMTHGLDINEINYDANNRWNRVNSHWTSFSKNNFHNKSKCIIEQYNNFTVPEVGLNVNGTLTQGETVADNGGVKAAYRAYKELLNNDKKLPGLNYSPEQLFWISYGNSWCEKNSTEVLRIQLSRVHPPSKFRVIGALSNMPEFAKDFNCPSGSNMNPNKKCSVW
ncbi:hypothetical protein HCN44_008132 [Aphidius gifuensis]|uniref:Uncharacterized protein n=1 Tax=Aphidius gifuensis TaxID=684658 RepID=A0A834XLL3_APHGI|nr:hypothetical protein HCN44_008132 [Aphidius gifuensis]